MNFGIVIRVLGILLIIESILMLPSLFISIYTNGIDKIPFLIAIGIGIVIGVVLSRRRNHKKQISARDGLAIVSLGWIMASIIGAIPLYLSNSTPTYIDAFFEIVSGLTTTGATVIANVEGLPQGIIFWRSFTHWIGGMGILVFTIALLPALGVGGFQIYKAESPGPVAGKIAPRIKDTAKILYKTYGIITITQVILLLIGGMSLFESLIHTFGTVGTGGFSNKGNSIAFYNSTYIHLVIGIFMVLSGVNFSLYYSLFKKKFKEVFNDGELKLYLGIVLAATLFIALNLIFTSYSSVGLAFRDSFFQVGSIMTTTGYSTVDFDLWPSFSKGILLILMVIGGSAGSTAGGTKVIRILVLFKLIKRETTKIFHPRAVIPLKDNGKTISDETVVSICSFMALYVIIFALSTLLVSLEGVDLISAASSVLATLSNVGPGLGFIGPTRTFGEFHQITKVLFSILMLLGRLELFTIIALIAPKNWRREL
ncbi:MAG: TrkH family potassium uptake protein [Tissierellaceae bacterium]|nr:TrkH family potassium uptake protein [Tissierellaceae bacterium]